MLQQITKSDSLARFYAGENIFKEGQAPSEAYLIKTGTVELYIFRDGKRVLIDTLSAGQSFGEIGIMINQPREMNACATTFTELIVVTREYFNRTMKHADPVFQKLAFNLATRLKKAEAKNCNAAAVKHPLIVFSEILLIHAQQFMNGPPVKQVILDYDKCCLSISRITGYSLYLTNSVLQDMQEFNLLWIHGEEKSRTIILNPHNLITRATSLSRRIGDEILAGITAEQEYIDADTVSEMVGIEKSRILKKMAHGEFADDIFLFRKSKVLNILNEKGKRFFERHRIKRPDEFEEITDIEYVDLDTLQQVFGAMEPFKLAKLVKGTDEETAQRIRNCLSKRRQSVLDSTIADIEGVDYVETAELENSVIDEIKAIKLSK